MSPNARGGGSAHPEGVIDLGIIVPACFENSLKGHRVKFLCEVMPQRRRIAPPTSAIVWIYHMATRYLRVPMAAAKKAMEGT